MDLIEVIFVWPLLFSVYGKDNGYCNFCAWEHCKPTMEGVEENEFNPLEDALIIGESIGKIRIRTEKVFNILINRNEKQREAISSKYKEIHGHKIEEDLQHIKLKTSKNLIKFLISPLSRFYTKHIEKAMKEKDEKRMVEIFTILPPCAVKQVHEQYGNDFTTELKNDIELVFRENPNTLKPILILSEGNRTTTDCKKGSSKWNNQIEKDVKDLEKTFLQNKWKDVLNQLNEVFGRRTLPQIREIIARYNRDGCTLEDELKKTLDSECLRNLYLTILRIAQNQPVYFATLLDEMLRNSRWINMHKKELSYIILGRCRVDLADIKEAFHEEFGGSLYRAVEKKLPIGSSSYYKWIIKIIKED